MRFPVVFMLLALSMPAYAASDDVPEAIQGKWVGEGEACDALGAPLVISATTLIYADGRIDDVFFSPDDGADGTIHFRTEGEVSNYEYVAEEDVLVFHPEGFGMGSALPMFRCPEPADFERRCGWLANPTPGNWWLIDADRTWTLSSQGDDNATTTAVMDRVPAFDADEQAARRDAALQLLDEHLLAGIRPGRQEGRQVGAEARVLDDQHAGQQHGQPDQQRDPAMRRAVRGLAAHALGARRIRKTPWA